MTYKQVMGDPNPVIDELPRVTRPSIGGQAGNGGDLLNLSNEQRAAQSLAASLANVLIGRFARRVG